MRILHSQKLVAISKPRCGSTSIRRMLDPFISEAAGDIACDFGQPGSRLHPHLPAVAVEGIFEEEGWNRSDYVFMTTVRHPLDMLYSYYSFFKPDEKSHYNFMPKWSGDIGMTFEDWVLHGNVKARPSFLELTPASISVEDLSPLSLEFYGMDRDHRLLIDKVFRLEEPAVIAEFLSERFGQKIPVEHVNRSGGTSRPALGDAAMDKVRAMLPYESRLYGI